MQVLARAPPVGEVAGATHAQHGDAAAAVALACAQGVASLTAMLLA